MNNQNLVDIESELSDMEGDYEYLFGNFEDEREELIAIAAAIVTNMDYSAPVTRNLIFRNRIDGHNRLYDDYFGENPVYNEKIFRRRFRMRHELFFRICEGVIDFDEYFIQKRDAAGILGYSTFQKVTAALRMLCYGAPADSLDEYLRMSETVIIASMKKFCEAVIGVFGDKYLRKPNEEDITLLLEVGKERGFPGMLGSIDCMHWAWKNCPTAWQGQFTGKEQQPTLVLEAVASKDLWFWHSFFGLPGCLNDINVLDRSDVFQPIADGTETSVEFEVNGKKFDMGYYLADGIYPNYATLIKAVKNPNNAKEKVE